MQYKFEFWNYLLTPQCINYVADVVAFCCVVFRICVCAYVFVWLFVASPHTYRHTTVACSALNALAVAFAVVALYYCYMRLNVHMFGPLEQAQEIEKKEEQMEAPMAATVDG